MSRIFLNFISFVFLTGLLFAAYPAQAQRKTATRKKTPVVKKTKVAPKPKTTPKPIAAQQQTATTPQFVPNRTTIDLLTRMETNTGIYRRELTRGLIRSNLNGTDSEAAINAYVADFENAEKSLRTRVESGNDSVADVQDVLNRAEFIQGFLRDNPLSPAVQSQWKILTDNLVTLANLYKVSWNINANLNQNNQVYVPNNPSAPMNQPVAANQPNYSNNQRRNNSGARFDSMLTGTYRLNASQSDNVGAVLDKTLNNVNNNDRTADPQADRMRRMLERRLASPDMFVIEKTDTEMTIASNLSPQVTVAVDNVARTEVSPSGRNVSVKASALNNALEISYQGDRQNDFFLTFMPVQNQQLRVTRRLYLGNLDQTVTVTSVYDKILPTADFTVVNNNSNVARSNRNRENNPTATENYSEDYVVPSGTQLVAVLSTTISTQTVNEGERFTLEVRSPSQYAGAFIEGYVSNTQTGTGVANRAQVTFNFDRIRLRDGSVRAFSGLVDVIRLPNGNVVNVLNESGNNVNQSRTQSNRSNVGGALGAILGAIISGGQTTPAESGTAPGTGSGTILVRGQNNLDLEFGTEFRIITTTPANLRADD